MAGNRGRSLRSHNLRTYYGGDKVKISWTVNGETQADFKFKILGIPNPDAVSVVQPIQPYIQSFSDAPWMTLNIGIHESDAK